MVRLEQGRARHPSPQVLGALARALRLTEDERDHLFRVGGAPVPSRGLVPRHVPPGVQRVIDRLGDMPIAVASAAWDLVQWNPLWTALTGDPSVLTALERNVAWRHFMTGPGVIDFAPSTPRSSRATWSPTCRDAVGRYPADPGARDPRRPAPGRLTGVRTALGRGPRRAAPVEQEDGDLHPGRPRHLDCDVLTVPGSDLRLVVYSAVAGSEDASKLELLRVTRGHALTR